MTCSLTAVERTDCCRHVPFAVASTTTGSDVSGEVQFKFYFNPPEFWPPVILSFLLLVVLQSVTTEGSITKPSFCPSGIFADKNGKCIPTFKEAEAGLREVKEPEVESRINDEKCPSPSKYTKEGKCLRSA
ncbi:UNVERIFIED_CONTAM: hypothetical protein PYX00_004188 [Menopon gallinae]|uniref:Uncharacterized protein n=1 Tax=Menopon gallinae TaxID=328185 RepID=A0AAW2I4N6_9NEOP